MGGADDAALGIGHRDVGGVGAFCGHHTRRPILRPGHVNLLAAFIGIGARQQFVDGDGHKVRVGGGCRAVCKRNLQHFGQQVHAVHAAKAHGFDIEAFQNFQHLTDVQGTGAGRRRTCHFKAAVHGAQDLPVAGLVATQIGQGHIPIVLGHVTDQGLAQAATIE